MTKSLIPDHEISDTRFLLFSSISAHLWLTIHAVQSETRHDMRASFVQNLRKCFSFFFFSFSFPIINSISRAMLAASRDSSRAAQSVHHSHLPSASFPTRPVIGPSCSSPSSRATRDAEGDCSRSRSLELNYSTAVCLK